MRRIFTSGLVAIFTSGLVALAIVLGGAGQAASAGSAAPVAAAPAAGMVGAVAAIAAVRESASGTGILFGFGSKISCGSPTACLAIGSDLGDAPGSAPPTAEAWNGTAWRSVAVKTPKDANSTALTGVSCKSATSCLVVGGYTTASGAALPYAMTWNGISLTPTAAPPVPGKGNSLLSLGAVSCVTAGSCVAVGMSVNEAPLTSTPLLAVETWNGATWALRTAADPGGAALSEPTAISCLSVTSCVAAGTSFSRTDTESLLLATWNGKAFTAMKAAAPAGASGILVLNDVSCTSVTRCVAAGLSVTSGDTRVLGFTEVLNGSSWTAGKVTWPKGDTESFVLGVSCMTPTSCVAVGAAGTSKDSAATALSYNGTTWSQMSVPGPGQGNSSAFTGVSCPAANECVAIGEIGATGSNAGVPLTGLWNGRTWKLTSAAPALAAVPALAASTVRSVATPSGPRAPAAGIPGTFFSLGSRISCGSAKACLAVGWNSIDGSANSSPVAMAWNGTAWRSVAVRTPRGTSSAALTDVSCKSAASCLVVGAYTTNAEDGAPLPYAMTWNGTSLTPTAAPPAPAHDNVALDAVSCVTARSCVAVGTSVGGTSLPLVAETWNGSKWALHPARNASGALFSEPTALSCLSATSCVTAGVSTSATGAEKLFLARWNGSAFAAMKAALPAGSGGFLLLGDLSCTSVQRCVAVGVSLNSAGTSGFGFTEVLNGAAWTTGKIAAPKGDTASFGLGVSCATPTSCVAVGEAGTAENAAATALSYNGRTWSRLSVPGPGRGKSSLLTGVSCPKVNDCVAIGAIGASGGTVSAPLAGAWNGRTWKLTSA